MTDPHSASAGVDSVVSGLGSFSIWTSIILLPIGVLICLIALGFIFRKPVCEKGDEPLVDPPEPEPGCMDSDSKDRRGSGARNHSYDYVYLVDCQHCLPKK